MIKNVRFMRLDRRILGNPVKNIHYGISNSKYRLSFRIQTRYFTTGNNRLMYAKDRSKTQTLNANAQKDDGRLNLSDNRIKQQISDSLSIEEPEKTILLDENETEIVESEEMKQDDFLTTIFENMEPYMDTYHVFTELTESGFTDSQADEIINLLIVQLNSKLSKLSTKYSQLYELENEEYLYESAQQELRVDFTRSRELHINELINSINIIEREFHILSDELNNQLIQMKNDTQVAISDQKSENTLLSKRIILRIQETNHKITTELNSAMRSEVESLRWHFSRWGLLTILIAVFDAAMVYYIHKSATTRRENEKNEFIPLIIYEPSEYDEDDYHTDLDKSLIN